MPTLNQAGFIAESVRSVMDQSVEGLELVVADGGSTDDTPSLLAELAAKYGPRLHWRSEPDRGPADAVNKAVARARAPIVGWLNSDDLYAPGAVARALAHFAREPAHVLVYGEAEHVDAQGAPLGRYPSLPPATPLSAWADGCPICQPSAFFRREAFDALGGLDTTLGAAFDYEFWLRLLKRYPGRVGFVDALQARSRLHAGAITLRMRERVALEGIEVVRRHVGPAPLHWLLTHVDELLAEHPFHRQPLDLVAHLRALCDRMAYALDRDAGRALDEYLRAHRGVALSSERFGCSVYHDGWAPPVLELRLRQGAPAVRTIRLHGRHVGPRRGRLDEALASPLVRTAGRLAGLPASPPAPLRGFDVDIELPSGERLSAAVLRPGPFSLEIPVDDDRTGKALVFRLHASAAFVPRKAERSSTDTRALSYQVDEIELA